MADDSALVLPAASLRRPAPAGALTVVTTTPAAW